MTTIGELTNVPEPGAAVASQWTQDASNRLHHRFASKAALDGWTTALVGTEAITLDTMVRYYKVASGWAMLTPWSRAVTGVGITSAVTGPGTHVASQTLPADPAPRLLDISCFIRYDRNIQNVAFFAYLQQDGLTHARQYVQSINDVGYPPRTEIGYIQMSVKGCQVAAGAAPFVVVTFVADSASCLVNTYPEAAQNRLDVVAYPGLKA